MSRVTSVKITDKDGKKKTISEPLFGSLKVSNEGGRTIITKKGFFSGEKQIIPSNEERVEIEKS